MFGNLRLQCRQYGGAIRYFRKMERLLLQYLICNKIFFYFTGNCYSLFCDFCNYPEKFKEYI